MRRTMIRRCTRFRRDRHCRPIINTRHENRWETTKLGCGHLDKIKPEMLVNGKNTAHVRTRNGLSVLCCAVVCCCVCLCCVCVCVLAEGWRGAGEGRRGPCVDSKRPRVYVQNVFVCTGTTRTCVSTCARDTPHTPHHTTHTPCEERAR